MVDCCSVVELNLNRPVDTAGQEDCFRYARDFIESLSRELTRGEDPGGSPLPDLFTPLLSRWTMLGADGLGLQ